MTPENRETLQRAAGMLDGLSASGDLTSEIASMMVAVSEMIDEVLKKENFK